MREIIAVTATRVGVYTKPLDGHHTIRSCTRCGHPRAVRLDRPHDLCADCKLVDPTFGATQQKGPTP